VCECQKRHWSRDVVGWHGGAPVGSGKNSANRTTGPFCRDSPADNSSSSFTRGAVDTEWAGKKGTCSCVDHGIGECDIAIPASSHLSSKSDDVNEAFGAKFTGSVFGGDCSEKVLRGDTKVIMVFFTPGCRRLHLMSSKPVSVAGCGVRTLDYLLIPIRMQLLCSYRFRLESKIMQG
jgi:hypothetical protein